jgi:hypothetical protein
LSQAQLQSVRVWAIDTKAQLIVYHTSKRKIVELRAGSWNDDAPGNLARLRFSNEKFLKEGEYRI